MGLVVKLVMVLLLHYADSLLLSCALTRGYKHQLTSCGWRVELLDKLLDRSLRISVILIHKRLRFPHLAIITAVVHRDAAHCKLNARACRERSKSIRGKAIKSLKM